MAGSRSMVTTSTLGAYRLLPPKTAALLGAPGDGRGRRVESSSALRPRHQVGNLAISAVRSHSSSAEAQMSIRPRKMTRAFRFASANLASTESYRRSG
jgi:hypothetical protein